MPNWGASLTAYPRDRVFVPCDGKRKGKEDPIAICHVPEKPLKWADVSQTGFEWGRALVWGMVGPRSAPSPLCHCAGCVGGPSLSTPRTQPCCGGALSSVTSVSLTLSVLGIPFPGVAVTNHYKLGGLKHRHSVSHCSGAQKSETKVSAELVPSESLGEGLSQVSVPDCGGSQQPLASFGL